ncbi:MAG: hypothetical protein ACKOXB_05755 [Flavobacteriales bacterium]
MKTEPFKTPAEKKFDKLRRLAESNEVAEAERIHENFKEIRSCPCCAEKTLVVYKVTTIDLHNLGKKKDIDWVKCYLCDYHLRFNAGDPALFDLHSETLFNE